MFFLLKLVDQKQSLFSFMVLVHILFLFPVVLVLQLEAFELIAFGRYQLILEHLTVLLALSEVLLVELFLLFGKQFLEDVFVELYR